jgi:predicted amidohydrolase
MVVTFYQQNIVWGDVEANRHNVEEVLAAAPKGDIFVVPETFTTGFGDHMARQAEQPLGPTFDFALQPISVDEEEGDF